MPRNYTVTLTSTPVAGLTEDHVDAFSSALFADPTIAAPSPGARLLADRSSGVLSVITSVDATSPEEARAVAEAAFVRAAEQAGVKRARDRGVGGRAR